MPDARRLGGKGKLAYRNLLKGPTGKLRYMVRIRGSGVEYFCEIAAACLKMLTNRTVVIRYAACDVALRCTSVGAIEPKPISVSSTASSSGVCGSFPNTATNRELSMRMGSRHR